MKGIILAAGKGTRLYPITSATCKPLLPVYDKPMIYYPISTLMMAGIREILIIIPPGQESGFKQLLGDGRRFGVNIGYAVQEVPRGIADAFIIGKRFIGDDSVCLVLGDNVFWHPEFETTLKEAVTGGACDGATVFGIKVEDPRPFGVVEFDENGKAMSVEEKPKKPRSQYIVPGLYFYHNDVVEIAKALKPSLRGELEITDVNLAYLKRDALKVFPLVDEFVWFDAGTVTTLYEAACKIYELQQTGEYIAYPEKIAFDSGYIDRDEFIREVEEINNTEYGERLMTYIRDRFKISV